jgi:hypothetical protein
MADDHVAAALQSINAELERMVAGEVEPYEAGWHVWSMAGRSVELSPVMGSVYLMWGALTDWPELRPEEKTEADAAMLRAAAEWLGLDDDAARERYFDTWLYGELGYARPVELEGDLVVIQLGAGVRDPIVRVSDAEGGLLFDSEAPDAPRIYVLSVVGLDGRVAADKWRLATIGEKGLPVWPASRVIIAQGAVMIWMR